MGGKEEAAQVLAAKFAVIFPHLDERQRRLLMAAEAAQEVAAAAGTDPELRAGGAAGRLARRDRVRSSAGT